MKLHVKAFPVLLMLVSAILLIGCTRGTPKTTPPIHMNPNMDVQPKYNAQSSSEFFVDGATMRAPVTGTIARGELREDRAYYFGRDQIDSFLVKSPVPTTLELLQRGQERFDIYCSPCHGRIGDGKGILTTRGYLPPPTYHQDRLRQVGEGYLFDVVTNGIRNMPSYRAQIPVADRWAIVAYVRALQRSQNAPINDVPLENQQSVK